MGFGGHRDGFPRWLSMRGAENEVQTRALGAFVSLIAQLPLAQPCGTSGRRPYGRSGVGSADEWASSSSCGRAAAFHPPPGALAQRACPFVGLDRIYVGGVS